ncbi:hypothetical protein ACJJTC_009051, partial [Scirpophaga incertulas]
MSAADKSTSHVESESILIETHEVEENGNNLSFFQASLFATILEDTITELRILAECNNELRIRKAWSDMTLLLARKFDVKRPKVTDELEGINIEKLESDEYKL